MPGYHLRAREDLARRQGRLLFRGLVRVLLVGEAEAGRAAGALALLQRRRVPLVHAVQRAPAHSPVEVVHALSLEKQRGF